MLKSGWTLDTTYNCLRDPEGVLRPYARIPDEPRNQTSHRGDLIIRKFKEVFPSEYAKLRAARKKESEKRFSNIKPRFCRIIVDSRTRALKKGMEHTITIDHIWAMYERQPYCALTNVKFELTANPDKFRSNPFGPSIDRIDSSKGYTPDNVRLVTVQVNRALSEYTDDVFYKMCEAALAVRGGHV